MNRSLLYIHGVVPGPLYSLVRIRDSLKRRERQTWELEYPTWLGSDEELGEGILSWAGEEEDPFEKYIHDNEGVAGKGDNEED